MSPRIFISYSHKDERWKDRLVGQLRVLELEGELSLWDDRKIAAGDEWLPEIREALASADAAVLLISADFLTSEFIRGEEVPTLLRRRDADGVRVIPLIVRPCPWKAVTWLAAMQIRPKDAQALSLKRKPKVEECLADLALEIRGLLTTQPAPSAAKVSGVASRARVEIGRLPAGGRLFIARQDELRLLDDGWADNQIDAISIVAMGGAGKSALVDEWLRTLRADGWRGARRVYGWSFYSQGTEDRLTSTDAFIDDALTWFGDPDPSGGSPWDRGLRLAELVRRERTLLVLDGVEPLQHPPGPLGGRLKDPALAALVKSLSRWNNGLLVISTRETIDDIASWEDASAPRLDLGTFSNDDGAALLELLGVRGTLKERQKASSQYKGHALALNLLGTYLVKACDGEIRQLPEIDIDEAVVAQGGHAWRVIAAYERWLGEPEVSVLRLLGLFDRPAEPEALAVLRAGPVLKNLNDGLTDLDDRSWTGPSRGCAAPSTTSRGVSSPARRSAASTATERPRKPTSTRPRRSPNADACCSTSPTSTSNGRSCTWRPARTSLRGSVWTRRRSSSSDAGMGVGVGTWSSWRGFCGGGFPPHPNPLPRRRIEPS